MKSKKREVLTSKRRKYRAIYKKVTNEQKAKWIRKHNIYRQVATKKNPILIAHGKLVSNWESRLHAAGISDMDWDIAAETLRNYVRFPDMATSKRFRRYKKDVTLANILNVVFTNYLAQLLINMDLNPEEVANRIGVDVDVLTNPVNWDKEVTARGHVLNKPGRIFTNPYSGEKWEFVWNYQEGADFHKL